MVPKSCLTPAHLVDFRLQAIHSRRLVLRRAIAAVFALLATVAGLTLLVQLLLFEFGSGSVDSVWLAVAANISKQLHGQKICDRCRFNKQNAFTS